ncbi:MAG: hypothetical protein KGL39_05280 [Patescibacteria group bacterium]|nr:hypothetical protein [Patescibacteria group bacterium]
MLKRAILALIGVTLLTAFSHGTLQNLAPVVTTTTLSSTQPAINGQAVGTVVATQSPTSWSITSCSGCSGYFAVSNAGAVTVTATGASNIVAATYNPVFQATNSYGSGSGTVAITFGGACAFGNSFTDGCPGAPVAGAHTVQHSNFLVGYANTNGQTYAGAGTGSCVNTNCHPPWNIAGVDYPVGIDASVVTSLVDPTTATASGSGANGVLPSGCTYTGNPNYWIECGGNTTDILIEGFDFGNTAQGCVRLILDSNATSSGHTVTIANNNFLNATNHCDVANSNLIGPNGQGAYNLVVRNNVIDSNGATLSSNGMIGVQDNTTGAITIQYNALLRNAGNAIFIRTPGDMTIQFNYSEGMSYPGCAPQHADWDSIDSAGGTVALVTFGFNAIQMPSISASCATTLIWISNGIIGSNFTTATVNNNVEVSNYYPAGSYDPVGYLNVVAYGTVGTLNWTQNYMDPNGANGCFAHESSPTITTENFTGNVNLRDGTATDLTHCNHSSGT